MALLETSHMDIPNAVQQVPPLMSAMIGPLHQQVHLHDLGEAGRYLQIGEEYAKRVMSRWGYANRDDAEVLRIARTLVWEYPDHGFVIDLTEAKELRLNAEELDEKADGLCKQILKGCDGCIGIFLPNQETAPTLPTASNREGETANGARSEDRVARVPANAGGQDPVSPRGARGARPAQGESAESEARANAPPNGAETLVAP